MPASSKKPANFVKLQYPLLESDPGIAKRIGIPAFVVYLVLRRYVWRSPKGPVKSFWEAGYLAARLTRKALAAACGVDPRSVTRYLAALMEKGWIVRHWVKGETPTYVLGYLSKDGETYFAEELSAGRDPFQGNGSLLAFCYPWTALSIPPGQPCPPPSPLHPYNGIDKGNSQEAGLHEQENGMEVEGREEQGISSKNTEVSAPRIDSGEGAGTLPPVGPQERSQRESGAPESILEELLRPLPGTPAGNARILLSLTSDHETAVLAAQDLNRWTRREPVRSPKGAMKRAVTDADKRRRLEAESEEEWGDGAPLEALLRKAE